MASPASESCPCGSNIRYTQCCLPYHQGAAIPPSAEVLMRSRYTAYVLMNAAYLKATWHPDTLPSQFHWDDQAHAQWLGLEIKRHANSDEHHAIVEFVARYKINGRAHRLHEVSRFVWEQGRWLYLDGVMLEKAVHRKDSESPS